MAQPVHQSSGDRLGVGTGAFERALDARLQCSLGNTSAVAADEKRTSCRPAREAAGFCRSSALFGVGETEGAAVEVGLDDREQPGLDRDATFLAAFAFDVDNGGTDVRCTDVANIGLAEFLGA